MSTFFPTATPELKRTTPGLREGRVHAIGCLFVFGGVRGERWLVGFVGKLVLLFHVLLYYVPLFLRCGFDTANDTTKRCEMFMVSPFTASPSQEAPVSYDVLPLAART